MARTPEGPAGSKPLSGLTGRSNIEPHEYIETAKEFRLWLADKTRADYEALAAWELELGAESETYTSSDDEDLSDVTDLPEGTHQIIDPFADDDDDDCGTP